VRVSASPELAFEVFTARIDEWWPREHHAGTFRTAVDAPGGWAMSLERFASRASQPASTA
jgi:hypothetical protein